MHCKSLWTKASAKCINVNVNVKILIDKINDAMKFLNLESNKVWGGGNYVQFSATLDITDANIVFYDVKLLKCGFVFQVQVHAHALHWPLLIFKM